MSSSVPVRNEKSTIRKFHKITIIETRGGPVLMEVTKGNKPGEGGIGKTLNTQCEANI